MRMLIVLALGFILSACSLKSTVKTPKRIQKILDAVKIRKALLAHAEIYVRCRLQNFIKKRLSKGKAKMVICKEPKLAQKYPEKWRAEVRELLWKLFPEERKRLIRLHQKRKAKPKGRGKQGSRQRIARSYPVLLTRRQIWTGGRRPGAYIPQHNKSCGKIHAHKFGMVNKGGILVYRFDIDLRSKACRFHFLIPKKYVIYGSYTTRNRSVSTFGSSTLIAYFFKNPGKKRIKIEVAIPRRATIGQMMNMMAWVDNPYRYILIK